MDLAMVSEKREAARNRVRAAEWKCKLLKNRVSTLHSKQRKASVMAGYFANFAKIRVRREKSNFEISNFAFVRQL